MHRGLDGLPEIPDGDVPGEFDHLVFVVHGIGSACDMKFRSIIGVTDGMREQINEMSERHFSYAHMAGKATRIEFLPVNWHSTLHGEDTGTDSRLKPLTLRSIPKLRAFVNDTILDVLFYTSPVYCQRILDTVVTEINRMYTLFMARNEAFKGEVSVIGHSLGSLIMFDVLCNQTEAGEQVLKAVTGAPNAGVPTLDTGSTIDTSNLSIEDLFQRLDIESEHAQSFVKEGIDMDALMTCTDDDLREAGLPLGPRKRLLSFIERRRKSNSAADVLNSLQAYQRASVTSDVKYTVGPAGTGQPSVKYPQLLFKVSAFYALGSPIGMFMAVRGIETLGSEFKFPTCRRFFNIFHPFDPVAYRVEALIDKEYGTKLKPVTIPHHKGRKRMHLELKDTVTKLMTSDIKQKLLSTVSAALGSMYNTVTGASPEDVVQKEVEQQIASSAAEQAESDANNPTKLDSKLNEGNRIDYVLQEAPFESFNEYVFALSSHLCYWESEDTFLMILKDLYGQMNILPDDQVGGMSGGQDAFGPTPIFEEKPTPVLINSLQSGPTPTLVNNALQTATPTLVNNALQTATPTLVNNTLQKPVGPPPMTAPPPAATSVGPPPLGPPPSASVGPPPTGLSKGYLKHPAYVAPPSGPPPTGSVGPPPPMGPPPTMGFVPK